MILIKLIIAKLKIQTLITSNIKSLSDRIALYFYRGFRRPCIKSEALFGFTFKLQGIQQI